MPLYDRLPRRRDGLLRSTHTSRIHATPLQFSGTLRHCCLAKPMKTTLATEDAIATRTSLQQENQALRSENRRLKAEVQRLKQLVRQLELLVRRHW